MKLFAICNEGREPKGIVNFSWQCKRIRIIAFGHEIYLRWSVVRRRLEVRFV